MSTLYSIPMSGVRFLQSREVEYIDEMGRTRRGTAAEAEAANRQRANTHDEPTTGEAHAEVL